MPSSITLTRTSQEGIQGTVNRTQAPMRCVLKQAVGDDPIIIEFPYGPTDVRYQQLAPGYSQIQRPGAKPIMVRTSEPLRTVSFTATIADKLSGGLADVELVLERIQALTAADVDCQFIYGLSALPYPVRVTQLDTSSTRRNLEGLLTQARISVQLTEIPAFDPFLGELTAVTPVGTRGSTPQPSRAVPAPDDAPETNWPIQDGESGVPLEDEIAHASVGGFSGLGGPGDTVSPEVLRRG